MATGGFKPNATTDFLEEWKAKREKMRAKMLGDIAAATGAPLGANTNSTSNNSSRHSAPPGAELTNNGNPDRSASAGNCLPSSYSVARSSSGTALKRPEEETHHPAAPTATPGPGSNMKKAPPQMEKGQCASPDSSPMACNDSDKESPSPSKAKEKNSSGPSARKGKGQIEKRKLREKRRSTGVVSIPSNESLDELDDDNTGEMNRREEEELVQANTFQNEAMTADPATGHLMETPRSGSGRHKSSARPGSEEEVGGNSRQRHNRHSRDGAAAAPGSLEKRMEELEKELARERQENGRLLKAHQDKDDLIEKLKEEIDLLNRDLDDIEDENEQLKQENKTLLKVVGQLTR
ncbi:PRKC apoptosis WT1 regulator protein [Siniperca chuatsi]|uniref:PRKC apoptosis WT1 regulator protein n=1 Tax=Siniperca chuatsi TaxID=119488 RepID=UPI001CE19C2D|nr:PRKC apoptosis WT1 regulator protein [Siniperca chuatsi]XP_044042627.1 PRKC apoptosis WT1 regulator protein [Siniperca chuatsi]XP_044042628.1 PRKC apoptosis WT1 regulator protein [Siniperca chuatsi]